MSYVVLARKWRPMRFEDLVGQDHVARTLGNAIASGRVAHAFLFTGVRGVGKTTSARIMAKALNCTRPPGTAGSGSDPGPTATPCLECSACREIALGTDVDVREIDGASYTGVDEVRKLQESLPYRPARDRFKIFIVDEVHMLSQSAWNAFLKTLEEPPPHVKFIFATTEAHKVPVTILSRVQRFDFKLIPTSSIVTRLRFVLDQESIRCDDAALSIIAREAAGSLRDAMSLLDQVIAWADEGLTGEVVSRVLGVASRQVLLDLSRALVRGDAPCCLDTVMALANQGFDLTHVAKDVLGVLRDLVVASTCDDPARLLDLPDQEQAEIVALGRDCSADDLLRLHQGFSRGLEDVLRSGQPRASLEMLLVRLARRPPLLPLDQVLSRLGALERRLMSPGSSSTPSRGEGGSGESSQQRAARVEPRQGQPRSPHRATPQRLPDEPEAPEEPPPRRATAPEPSRHPRTAEAPDPPAPPAAAGALEQPPLTPVAEPVASPGRETTSEFALWRAVVSRLAQGHPRLAASLEHAAVLELGSTRVRLGFEPASLPLYTAQQPAADALVRRAVAAELQSDEPALSVEAIEGPPVSTLAAAQQKERAQATRDAQERARTHPRVLDVERVLGARLKTVRFPE